MADLNGDGNLDIVALVSQETETIFAYLGDGAGSFRSQILFQAPPEFGSSGIELVDLDRDGDVDLLDFARFQACFTGDYPVRVPWQDERLQLSLFVKVR